MTADRLSFATEAGLTLPSDGRILLIGAPGGLLTEALAQFGVALDMNSEVNGKRKGSRKDNDYALAWVKKYGKGRVFVSAFGHNKEVFYDPEILKMWVEGFRFVLGEIEVETESIAKPEFNLPKG